MPGSRALKRGFMLRHRPPCALLVATAVLAVSVSAAPADAAVSFGSDLASASTTLTTDPCPTLVFTSGAGAAPCAMALVGFGSSEPFGLPNGAVAPVGGVVTSFAVRETTKTPLQLTFHLMRMTSPLGSGTVADGRFVGTGPTVELSAAGAIVTAPARLPVAVGDVLAGSNSAGLVGPAYLNVATGMKMRIFQTAAVGVVPLKEGTPGSTNDILQPAIQATIEADADADRYGDETQDACPADPAKQALPCVDATPAGGAGAPTAPPAAADTIAPALQNVVIRAGKLLFTSDEDATVLVRITRLLDGRRKGKRCVAPTRKIRRAKRCTRRGPSSTITSTTGAKGGSTRLNTRLLRKGRYEISITARDAAGNTSKPIRRALTVKR